MKNNGHPRLPRKILSVDVGGSKVKLLLNGETEPRKFRSGEKLTPAKLVEQVRKAAKGWDHDAVSIGLPALVGPEGPLAEPGNLAAGWVGFDYAVALGCPVRMANDAAMQALGSYDGGRMLFLGFGTGLGSALIADHILIGLELGELHFEDGTYSERLGREGFDELGKKDWRKLALRAIPPPNVRLGNNLTAFRGGFRLWGIEEVQTLRRAGTSQDPRARRPATGDWRVL